MHVVIFEGSRWNTFAPLSLSRPVFALASGACTLIEKQVRHVRPTRLTLWVRPGLARWCEREIVPKFADRFPVDINRPLGDETALLVSGRTLHFTPFEHTDDPCAIVDEGDLVRKAVVRMPGLSPDDAMTRSDQWLRLLDLPRADEQARMAQYVWDLIGWNEESLLEDAVAMHGEFGRSGRHLPPGPYHIVNENNVLLGQNVRIDAGVVLDGSKGPVMIAPGASIGANSVIKGPCFIGPLSIIKPLTVIHPGVTLGPLCKVGGEVNNSILTGYSNKSHEGYLGDSYVGEWVNLGASTVTSNLKNTYGPVRVRVGAREFDTGRRHLGSLIGDHVKTAVGTRLMTGSYIGYSSMIATSAMAPTFVPSFSFLTDKGGQPYRVDKATEVMKAMYARRNKVWPPGEDAVVDYAKEAAAQIEIPA
jgi:UDP-N-acetylglucosamine diphosphorylase / glucose-1-phosphate thymidylyltransferase / UDP-N-acetylgalactosamine diphosphorylase / glucosamine-1-phosphate N-acetyltransferase / galactosamine-1-phosphate N-acetyltransferase